MKPKYKKECLACGSVQWEKINEHVNFEGNEVWLFECQHCGHRTAIEKIFLLRKEKIKNGKGKAKKQ